MGLFGKSTAMVNAASALPGRNTTMPVPATHYENGHRIVPPFPDGMQLAQFAMGCFWGAERAFWELPGVYSTAVGYAGGYTPNPTYQEVCSGQTGHTEMVLVVYDPAQVSYGELLKTFWEAHDPTQGMRQGNDIGTSYRSAIFPLTAEQEQVARDTIADVDASGLWLAKAVTTIEPAGPFWEAEPEHQDYLQRYPNGYNCHYPRAGWVLPRRIQATEASV